MSTSTLIFPGTKGIFACFHRMNEPCPIDESTLNDDIKIYRLMEGFYKEAARRLPLDEMPELDGCVSAGGHCFGLADPVANIILNAIGLLLHDQQGDHHPYPRKKKPKGWLEIASQSLDGCCAFMTAYFRYLSTTQARRYLHVASYDLCLAIKLVHYDRLNASKRRRPLLPDGGKIKAALRIAALDAQYPAPDVLALLMTAKYPSDLLDSVVYKLRESDLLTTSDVCKIKQLLASQWPPNPQPANIEFRCRPNGNTCVDGRTGTLLVSTSVGDGFLARISIERIPEQHNHKHISELTFDNSDDLESKLHKCLQVAESFKALHGTSDVNYSDSSPCQHILSLELCLLDTIHAFYIEALAIMPTSPRLLRTLLVAGHCYGPMEPVPNIILNSIWYDVAFPLAQDVEVELPQDILDTKLMARLESRSLHGLLGILYAYCYSSKHQALEHLNDLDCNLTKSSVVFPVIMGVRHHGNIPFADVARFARHPQGTAYGSFIMSLSPEKINLLQSLICNAKWVQLIAILREESCSAVPMSERLVCPFVSLQLSGKKLSLMSRLDFLRTELNNMLCRYCNQHPWEPTYEVYVICGVIETKSSRHPNLCHANFLATRNDAPASDASSSLPHAERVLFFAEFWMSQSYKVVRSKPSICIGRCSFCEKQACRIIHPPSGGHSGDIDGLTNLYHPAHKVDRDDFSGLLESDSIYFDPDRDVELATVITNEFCKALPVMSTIQSEIYIF